MPVLLCVGGPGCADYLGPVADMIDDIARVIRYEQSKIIDGEHSMWLTQAEELKRFLREFIQGIQDICDG